jgi:hypothetical protein
MGDIGQFSAEDVLSRMSVEEKCSILGGHDYWRTKSHPSLGIKALKVSCHVSFSISEC